MIPPALRRETNRAQSETLGVVLLIGIAVIAAVAVATTGYAAITSDQERVGVEQAERALSQFDSRSSEVALGRSDGARVDFGLPDDQGTTSVRPDEGWMRVNYTDLTGETNSKTIANVTLGTVVFSQGDRTVGYQGGGVFRSEGDGSVLVSRPEFHYRNGTLTIPIIQTGGDRVGASRVQVTPNGTTRAFPDASRNLTNKVDDSAAVITVKSRYYEAWGEFFRRYTPGIVRVNHTRQTASVRFVSPPDDEGLDGGVVATSESGELALEGNGAYVDSYNSSEGPYNITQTGDGKIRSVGDLTMTGDSEINGDAEAGGSIVMDGDSLITGDANWTESKDIDGTVQGDINKIDGVRTVLPIDPLVENRVRELKRSNDNEDSFVSSGDVEVRDTKTIGAGQYYVDSLTVDGGTLVIDTTSGNVTIGVDDYISLRKGGGIDVQGAGTVKVYLNADEITVEKPTGEGKEEVNFYLGKGSTVSVKDNRAPRFRIYAQQEIQGYIGGSSGQNVTFNGLIYAPDGLEKDGDFYVKQAHVYGGVVAGTIRLGQYGQVHYDKSLSDIILPRAFRVSRFEYMHVAVHRMNVTSG